MCNCTASTNWFSASLNKQEINHNQCSYRVVERELDNIIWNVLMSCQYTWQCNIWIFSLLTDSADNSLLHSMRVANCATSDL